MLAGFAGSIEHLDGCLHVLCTLVEFLDYTLTFLTCTTVFVHLSEKKINSHVGALELCSRVNEGLLGVIASLRIGSRVCCACDACSHYRDHAMFLRSSSQPFIAFLKTRHLTRCLHRLTLPPIGHRVSSVRSFTTPAPQVAQRFGVALSFALHIRDDHCKKRNSRVSDKTAFSNNLNMMRLPMLPWRGCLTGCRIS